MKRNIALLQEQVRTALEKKCVSAIIAEAFINALPLNPDEVAVEAAQLARYSTKMVDKMYDKIYPKTLFDKANESTRMNPKENLFVKNLRANLSEVIESATKRIVDENAVSIKPNNEIVEAIKLNDKETEKLVEASKKSGIDAVSKLVKDKVIDVIKDEKNAYETSAKMRDEIKEIINEPMNDDSADAPIDAPINDQAISDEQSPDAIESYFNIVLNANDPRTHVSFFSKLQDICMEALTYSDEIYIEVPYETMSRITLESTLPYFDVSKSSTLEDEISRYNLISSIAQESECGDEDMLMKKKKIAKTAFICTICIMTFLEAMKTMHFIKPSVAEVRDFVDRKTDVHNIELKSLRPIETKVNAAISDVKKTAALGALGKVDLANKKLALENAKKEIEKLVVTESELDIKTKILNKIDGALKAFSSNTATESVNNGFDHYTTRKKEENLVALEHAISVLSRKPNVKENLILIDSRVKSTDASQIQVEMRGLDSNGKNVASYVFPLNCMEAFGETAVEIIRDAANYINTGSKSTSIYFTDSAYSVPLKD